jgi:hypothetical protein
MALGWLTSTALMGVLVLVLGWLAWSRGWYRYSPAPAVTPVGDAESPLWDDPRALGVAFAVLLVGAVGGVVAYITGGVGPQSTVGPAIALGTGGLLVAYLLGGVYLSATSRGHPRSLAVAESVTVAGALFLVAVTVQLLG